MYIFEWAISHRSLAICRFKGAIFKSYLRKELRTARKLHHHIQIHRLGVLEYADLRRSGHQQSASELEHNVIRTFYWKKNLIEKHTYLAFFRTALVISN